MYFMSVFQCSTINRIFDCFDSVFTHWFSRVLAVLRSTSNNHVMVWNVWFCDKTAAAIHWTHRRFRYICANFFHLFFFKISLVPLGQFRDFSFTGALKILIKKTTPENNLHKRLPLAFSVVHSIGFLCSLFLNFGNAKYFIWEICLWYRTYLSIRLHGLQKECGCHGIFPISWSFIWFWLSYQHFQHRCFLLPCWPQRLKDY